MSSPKGFSVLYYIVSIQHNVILVHFLRSQALSINLAVHDSLTEVHSAEHFPPSHGFQYSVPIGAEHFNFSQPITIIFPRQHYIFGDQGCAAPIPQVTGPHPQLAYECTVSRPITLQRGGVKGY